MSEYGRYCGSCGSQLPYADTHFCPDCGSRTSTSHEAQPSGKGRRIAMALLSLVVLLGLIGGGYALATRDTGQRDLAVAVTPTPTPSASPTPSPAPTVFDAAQLAQRLGPGVLRVEAEGCDSTSSGTAFAIGPNHLVTNHHVVSIDPDPMLVDRSGVQRQGRVIGWRESPDLAVIEVSDPLPVALPWANTAALAEGQTLVAIGYPVPDLAFSVTQADIVSFQEVEGVRAAVRTDGAVDRGNSGGPALTVKGEVAGVVTRMADNEDGFQHVALLYTADALAAEVQAILAAPQTVEPTCDVGLQEVPEGWFEDIYGEGGGAAEAPTDAYSYGDDPAFDALQDSCAAGDMYVCDQLYETSPGGSAYEAYGSSCGERTDPRTGSCVDWQAESEGMPEIEPEVEPEEAPVEPSADLTGLRAACEAGDLAACDSLFVESPAGSDDETFGATCGGRGVYEIATCVSRQGSF